MRRTRNQYVWALLVWAALTALVPACGQDAPKTEPPRTVAAPLRQLRAQTVVECRAFPAQVESRNSVTLASKLSGTVVEIFAQEGATLAAGSPILRIDDKDLQSRSRGLAASMSQAGMERQALAARVAHAKTNLARLEKLAAQKVISQDDFEKARSEYLALSREEEAIAERERSVAYQKEELASLAGYTRINAPFDGVLSRRYVDLGAFVGAGQPLALVDDVTGGFDLAAQVDESLLSAVRVGQVVLAAVPGLIAAPFSAKIGAVVGRIDPGSRTFKLKVDIPAQSAASGPQPHAGMFGRVFIPAREVAKLLLPAACLRPRGDLQAVFPVDDKGVVHLRIVKTGGVFHKVEIDSKVYLTDSEAFAEPDRERFLEVISGLSEGERLACDATTGLREGDVVTEAGR